MAKNKLTLQQFQPAQLEPTAQRHTIGGYKEVPGLPGGTGSIGLIDWGEIEIRLSGLAALSSKKSFFLYSFG